MLRLLAVGFLAAAFLAPPRAQGVILWSDLGQVLAHETGPGADITGGAVKRDDSANDALYFKFHVDPLSDVGTELYFAAFQLFEGDRERLAIGNSLKAWAYSAFLTSETGASNQITGDVDLRTARPETTAQAGVFYPYEFPRRGIERTIVFRVQYVAGGDDLVTVWLDPDLSPGATEENQSTNIITTFHADASFDEIRLRHSGGGRGWTFSEMAIATAFSDFVKSSSTTAESAKPAASSVSVRFWQHEQGLPHNSVRALAQTEDGYLWIGADDGISRFDGLRFVAYGERDGVPGGRIQVLFAATDGALWIGSGNRGLARRQHGRFTRFTTTNGLPSDTITALAEDNQKRVWIGTDNGLALSSNGQITEISAASPFAGRVVTALLKDRHGVMWAGIAGVGVFRFLQDRFERLEDASVEPLLTDPHCLLEDQAGRIWVGAGDDFVLCQETDQWRRYRIPRHLPQPYIKSLVQEPDGTVWAGSISEGLYRFKEDKLEVLNVTSGLSDNFVEALLVDREGTVWAGTQGGLNRIRRSKVVTLFQAEGLGYGPAKGLAEVAPGIIWAAQPREGILRYDGRRFERLGDSEFARRFSGVNVLLASPDGTCWAGSSRGVGRFRNVASGTPTEITADALLDKHVLALEQDVHKTIWAGTHDGELWHWQNGMWLPQTNLVGSQAIACLACDREGRIWIGSAGAGLWEYRTPDGPLVKVPTPSEQIRALVINPSGGLWIGTGGAGLIDWRKGAMRSLTVREGLPDNNVSQILLENDGRVWLGTDRGVACLSGNDLDQFASRKSGSVYPRLYGQAEGMMAEECAGGFSPAGLKTSLGLLWFPTLKGIAVIDPRPEAGARSGPAVVLEDVLVDGVSAMGPAVGIQEGEPAPLLRIAPGKHTIEFNYTSISFRAPERVRFRYQLEGLDTDWVEAKTRRTALYPYVPPGEYTFRVTACSSDGVWNTAGAAMPVLVMKHFWQARWLITLASFGLIGLVAGAVRVVEKRRHQRRVRQLEQERAIERERARIAQDLHDDLGSSLTRVSLLGDLLKADKDNPVQVESHAGRISHAARQTVRSLEEIVWALRPGSDTLQSLIEYIAHFANELFETDSTKCRMNLQHDLPSRRLPPEMRHNIFLIVKEALNNSLKHAQAKEVRVQAKANQERLELIIEDDGRGFDPALSRNGEGPGHHGLGNMQRRSEAINGNLEVRSTPGNGTSVHLSVKLPKS
jgi:signal transduction histidine kinase/ligand-binding sensor domain-containing protein